jgi:hypothetical protein
MLGSRGQAAGYAMPENLDPTSSLALRIGDLSSRVKAMFLTGQSPLTGSLIRSTPPRLMNG